jgi:hypothetical protein
MLVGAGAPALPRDAVAMVTVRLPELAAASPLDAATVERQVRLVHDRGYLVRLEGITAATSAAGLERLWTPMLDAGVDFISVDDIGTIGELLLSRGSAAFAPAD